MIRELLKKITPDSGGIQLHTPDFLTPAQYTLLNEGMIYHWCNTILSFGGLTYQQTVDLINAVADELGEPPAGYIQKPYETDGNEQS